MTEILDFLNSYRGKYYLSWRQDFSYFSIHLSTDNNGIESSINLNHNWSILGIQDILLKMESFLFGVDPYFSKFK